jgi:hypothetical protein
LISFGMFIRHPAAASGQDAASDQRIDAIPRILSPGVKREACAPTRQS